MDVEFVKSALIKKQDWGNQTCLHVFTNLCAKLLHYTRIFVVYITHLYIPQLFTSK